MARISADQYFDNKNSSLKNQSVPKPNLYIYRLYICIRACVEK